jgi:hypothetical protein
LGAALFHAGLALGLSRRGLGAFPMAMADAALDIDPRPSRSPVPRRIENRAWP